MKKLLILSTLSIFLISCSSEQKQKNSLIKENLKGNVKSLKGVSFEAIEKFGKIVKGIKKIDHTYKPKGMIYQDLFKKFNEKGFVIESKFTLFQGQLNFTYEYDNKNHLIERNSYNIDGSLKESEKYKYNNKGNQIESNCYNKDGSLKYKTKSKYDNKGNLIEQVEYNADGSLEYKDSFKYDNKGNLIEQIELNTKEIINYKITSRYDTNGNVIENTFHDVIKDSSFKRVYEYDEVGNIITQYNYNPDGSLDNIETLKYSYDKRNNWVKLVEFKNDMPLFIKERKIEYY